MGGTTGYVRDVWSRPGRYGFAEATGFPLLVTRPGTGFPAEGESSGAEMAGVCADGPPEGRDRRSKEPNLPHRHDRRNRLKASVPSHVACRTRPFPCGRSVSGLTSLRPMRMVERGGS